MLTRKMLKGMALTDEQIDTIIEAHTETVDGIKAERDDLKSKYADVEKIRTEYETLKAESAEGYKAKYEAEHKNFELYKTEQTANQLKAKKEEAVKAVLKACNIDERRYASILKVTNLDDVELDESGNIADAEKYSNSVKTEWADFVVTQQQQGAHIETPPAQDTVDYSKLSDDAYFALINKKG